VTASFFRTLSIASTPQITAHLLDLQGLWRYDFLGFDFVRFGKTA